jgi:hypothetical protein
LHLLHIEIRDADLADFPLILEFRQSAYSFLDGAGAPFQAGQ